MDALRTGGTVTVIAVLALCFVSVLGAHCHFESRATWGARDASDLNPANFKATPSDVVVREIHSREDFNCDTARSCGYEIKKIQSRNVYSRLPRDIPCNFIIGIRRVYEGRGWSLTSELGDRLVVCFLGNYKTASVDQTQINGLNDVIKCGVDSGMLTSAYKVMTLRDLFPSTTNPGDHLYRRIKNLEHGVYGS